MSPPSPGRRKLRMLRPGELLADTLLLIRAAPASQNEAVLDIAETALDSADDHFDLLLIDGRSPDQLAAVAGRVELAARRLVEVCGELHPNPSYAGGGHG